MKTVRIATASQMSNTNMWHATTNSSTKLTTVQESGQEDVQQTPPRRVVFKETVRNTPVKQRVGPTNSEKRKAQRTKSAKNRLGTKPSDFRPRSLDVERLEQQVPVRDRLGERCVSTGQDSANKLSTSVKQRIGPTNSEKRKAQRKSWKTRDLASNRQRFPRQAKESQTKCNQIDSFYFPYREEDTDSEEENYKASKSKE